MGRDLVAHALEVDWLNLAIGHRRFEAEGATFVVNPAYPSIHDANFLCDVAVASQDEIERLMARARKEFAHCPTLTVRIGPSVSPAFESWLAQFGTERHATLVMILEGDLVGTAKSCDLRPIQDEDGWIALRNLKRRDWRDAAHKFGMGPESNEIPDGLAAIARLKCPPVRYSMAWVDGTPVGFLNAWEGVDRLGQVEDLYVLPEFRHRGIATALIHRCVADARARGAGPIEICADPAETPKKMYVAMGWRPIAVTRQYGIKL